MPFRGRVDMLIWLYTSSLYRPLEHQCEGEHAGS